ncbi:MAG: flippase [Flavobacteriaceae bacterium]|nr:MAG: flippase [Flavobacteriaceae bacterium]
MIHKIKNILKNKDVKVLLENFISLSSLQLVGMILQLITLPYVLRILGFTNYGIVILAASLVAYFQAITDFSFKITATRDVAIFRNSQKKLNIIYSKVLTIKMIFLALSIVILCFVIFLYPPFYKERLVFFLTIPILFGYTLFPEWFFQGIEKMKYITFLNVGIKLFFTICIFIFIKVKEDYWIYPLLQSLGFIGAGIIGQFILIKKYKLKFIILKRRVITQTIVSNFPIFINQFFPTLYNNTSTFLLGILTTTSLVGVYDAVKKIIDLFISLLNIVSRVFFPFLNRKRDVFPKYKKLMLSISILFIIVAIALNKLIFWYLNINYENALAVLIILAIGILGYTLYDIFGLNYFIIRRKDKLVMNNTLIFSFISFILAFPLIYFFGIIGAAINLTFARFMMGGNLMLKWIKNENN